MYFSYRTTDTTLAAGDVDSADGADISPEVADSPSGAESNTMDSQHKKDSASPRPSKSDKKLRLSMLLSREHHVVFNPDSVCFSAIDTNAAVCLARSASKVFQVHSTVSGAVSSAKSIFHFISSQSANTITDFALQAETMSAFYYAWHWLQDTAAPQLLAHVDALLAIDPKDLPLPKLRTLVASSWPEATPLTLRLLIIVVAYQSGKRRFKSLATIHPSFVMDLSEECADEDDDGEGAENIGLNGSGNLTSLSLSSATRAYKDFAGGDAASSAVNVTLAILASWMGLRNMCSQGPKSTWDLWDLRGKMLHSIALLNMPGLLVSPAVYSSFVHPVPRAFTSSKQASIDNLCSSIREVVEADQSLRNRILSNGHCLLEAWEHFSELTHRAQHLQVARNATHTPTPTSSSSVETHELSPHISSSSSARLDYEDAGLLSRICFIILRFLRAASAVMDEGQPRNPISDFLLRDPQMHFPFREKAPHRAGMINHGPRDVHDIGGVFDLLIFRGITFNSPMLSSAAARYSFQTLEAFETFSHPFLQPPNAHGIYPAPHICNIRAFGQPNHRRCPALAKDYAKVFTTWPAFVEKNLQQNGRLAFPSTLQFMQTFKGIGPLTSMLVTEDLVYAKVVDMPSDDFMVDYMLQSLRAYGASAALRALGFIPGQAKQAIEVEVHGARVMRLYRTVAGNLTEADNWLMPDIIHFEHLLCKLGRALRDKEAGPQLRQWMS